MNGGDKRIGICRDDGCCFQLGAILAHPVFPDSGEGYQAMVGAVDEVRLLLAGDIALPFIEAIGGDEAAPPPEGVAEGRLLMDAFAAGVDERFSGEDFLGPRGHETPAHQSEMPGAVITLPHDGDGASRRHILARREVRLFHVVEKRQHLFRRAPETVESAHGARD